MNDTPARRAAAVLLGALPPGRRSTCMRLIRRLTAALLVTCTLGMPTMTSAHETDLSTILDALIADPKLAAYFHQNSLPARLPLQVVNLSGVELSAPDARHAGVACVLVPAGGQPEPGRAALIVDRVVLSDGRATAEFRLPVEGLAGDATMQHDADRGWTVTEMRLVER